MWSFIGLRNTLPQCLNESNLSFVDVANQMINRLKELVITIFFTTTWMIWIKCNKARQGTQRSNLTSLTGTTTVHALEYIEANFSSLFGVSIKDFAVFLYRNSCFRESDRYDIRSSYTKIYCITVSVVVLVVYFLWLNEIL